MSKMYVCVYIIIICRILTVTCNVSLRIILTGEDRTAKVSFNYNSDKILEKYYSKFKLQYMVIKLKPKHLR